MAGNPDRNSFRMADDGSTESQALAKLMTGGADMSGGFAHTLKLYSNTNDTIDLTDLAEEMHKAGQEVNAGNMARAERLLMAQFLTLDTLFNNLAQRAKGQETFRGVEVLTRLALKAQSQARTTAETLAVMKNPMPYIRQTNIANGPQQVNNGQQADGVAHAANFQQPDEVLEANEKRVDTRAITQAGRADTKLATVGAIDRPKVRSRQGKSSKKRMEGW